VIRAVSQSTPVRALAALLSIGIALVSYRYLTASDMRSPQVLANAFANPFLILHVLGAATALLVSPFQFIARFRSRHSGLHRIVGRLYVAGCLLGAFGGLPLALGSTAGPVASSGFAVLAVLWFATTTLGWLRAIQGRIAEHRQWMLRSWALTMGAVTLRLYLPIPPLLAFDFMDGYRAIAWLSWIPNLALVEIWLRSNGRARAASTVVAAA
jgi:uncharacterized membrane protein